MDIIGKDLTMSSSRSMMAVVLVFLFLLGGPMMTGAVEAQENEDPVISGIDVCILRWDGRTTPEAQKELNLYSFKYGKTYNLDITDGISDKEEGIYYGDGIENIDNLTIIWESDIDGYIGRGPSIDVGAGTKTNLSQFDLKAGKLHEITVTVTDPDGGSDNYTFTVKVSEESVDPTFPTQQACMAYIAGLIAIIVVVVAVAILYVNRKQQAY